MLNGVTIDLHDAQAAQASATALGAALDATEGRGITVSAQWDERSDKHRLRIERRQHGNWKTSTIDADFLVGADYAALHSAASVFRGLLGEGARVARGEGERTKEAAARDFRAAMQWLLDQAENSVSKQRYKGLGEMNPEQLWETTMDPAVRRLLKVQIEDAIGADAIFATLMGDEVEPRRIFIEENALSAGNIDI